VDACDVGPEAGEMFFFQFFQFFFFSFRFFVRRLLFLPPFRSVVSPFQPTPQFPSPTNKKQQYADTLDGLDRDGSYPPLSLREREIPAEEAAELSAAGEQGVSSSSSSQLVADVFPCDIEAALFGGVRGEVWLRPGKPATQARDLKEKKKKTKNRKNDGDNNDDETNVALVLGAGNQLPAVVLDVLHKLVVEGDVVALKMNPVNDYLGPFISSALEPLVTAGFVAFLYGGGNVGAAAAEDPRVSSVHLTGSGRTFDALVWKGQAKKKVGGKKEGDKGAAKNENDDDSSPAWEETPLGKPVTGELGCVTPVIVLPPAPGSSFSEADLAYWADELVAGIVNNAAHNCLASELILTDGEWPQRGEFLEALTRRLDAEPRRVAYYPGSADRMRSFVESSSSSNSSSTSTPSSSKTLELGQPQPVSETPNGPVLPWTLRTGVGPEEAATQEENWCGAVQEVAFSGCGGDPAKFADAAVAFANSKCSGTLSCVLVAHPSVDAATVDAAIARLRYGSVCVNVSNLLGFCVPALTWGAWLPGGTPEEIGTGNVAVHNAYLLDHVQKSVLRAPWRFRPAHLWSSGHRNLEGACEASCDFFSGPGVVGLLRVAAAALRG